MNPWAKFAYISIICALPTLVSMEGMLAVGASSVPVVEA